MTEQARTDQEQSAIQAVQAWLSTGDMQPPDWDWTVYPFQDAQLVCPVTRARGSAIYLVRRGEVRPVLSNRRKTADDVYREMVADQG